MKTNQPLQQRNGVSEAVAIAMYQMGTVDGGSRSIGNGHEMDIHELLEIAESITKDWNDFFDIQNIDEEGYIGKYAVRRFIEILKAKQDANGSDPDGLGL